MNQSAWLVVISGMVIGAVAGAMAYLISYNEYLHHYTDKQQPRRLAFQAALVTFSFFFLSTLAITYVLVNFVL